MRNMKWLVTRNDRTSRGTHASFSQGLNKENREWEEIIRLNFKAERRERILPLRGIRHAIHVLNKSKQSLIPSCSNKDTHSSLPPFAPLLLARLKSIPLLKCNVLKVTWALNIPLNLFLSGWIFYFCFPSLSEEPISFMFRSPPYYFVQLLIYTISVLITMK